MTDAEKLREIGRNYVGYDFSKDLFRIASLLDAVPPETLVALKAGTWRAVPMKPTAKMRDAIYHNMAGEILSTKRAWYNAVATAPAKPEG